MFLLKNKSIFSYSHWKEIAINIEEFSFILKNYSQSKKTCLCF